MVLIHGGGGTAFARWVKVWNERVVTRRLQWIFVVAYLLGPLAIGSVMNKVGHPVGMLPLINWVNRLPTNRLIKRLVTPSLLIH